MTGTVTSYQRQRDETIFSNPVPVRYAGFWMRFWAYLTDLFITGAISLFIVAPFVRSIELNNTLIGQITLNTIISFIVFVMYFAITTKYFNQTIGKMLFGIKVVRGDQAKLTWADIFYREILGRTFYQTFGLMNVLYIGIAFTPEKQGLHDFVADTRVVHEE